MILRLYFFLTNKKIKIIDISKYDYIVLNLTDIDTQFKVYKKILEINGKISQNANVVDKNNTITIKKVKDSYSREEVDRMLDEQASKTTAEILEKFKDYKSRDEVIKILKTMHINLYGVGISELEQVDNWIKENL